MKGVSQALIITAFFVATVGYGQASSGDPEGRVSDSLTAHGLHLAVDPPFETARLTVNGSDGVVFEGEFGSDFPIQYDFIDQWGGRIEDGHYTYELRIAPLLGESLKRQIRAARVSEDPILEKQIRRAFNREDYVHTGSFLIVNGLAVDRDLPEPTSMEAAFGAAKNFTPSDRWSAAVNEPGDPFAFDQVINDDLIVTGSLCVGFDCVDGESFGFDTLRLKENNTRMHFADTSTVSGFPDRDWELIANDAASGGLNYFAILDRGTGRQVFKVEADAPSNSIYASSAGRVGLGTSVPALELHISTGNAPSMRLDQDGSSGFAPQVWDVVGNEANFFVRDVTGGSRLPFRIRPGAPTSSIDIAASGNVGIGLTAPERQLHVRGSNAAFRMDRNADTTGMLLVRTNASHDPLKTFLIGTNASGANNGEFIINDLGQNVGGSGARRLTITNNGDAHFTGTVQAAAFVQASSLRFKSDVQTVRNALNLVNRLRGVSFNWRESGRPSLGLIAEEVDDVVPQAVQKNEKSHEAEGVNYSALVAVLIEAVKDQQRQIQALEGRLMQLERSQSKPVAGARDRSAEE